MKASLKVLALGAFFLLSYASFAQNTPKKAVRPQKAPAKPTTSMARAIVTAGVRKANSFFSTYFKN